MAHINQTKNMQPHNLVSLLTENGIFMCEECDNSAVKFIATNIQNENSETLKKANRLWRSASKAMMEYLGNDLELTPNKIKADLLATDSSNGNVSHVGSYQIVLQNKAQKKLLADGYRSSQRLIESVMNLKFNDFIDVFDLSVSDEKIEIKFLQQHIVTFKNEK